MFCFVLKEEIFFSGGLSLEAIDQNSGSSFRDFFVKTTKKSYIVERTNKAEMRPEKQSEKAESCQENSWNEIQLKEP